MRMHHYMEYPHTIVCSLQVTQLSAMRGPVTIIALLYCYVVLDRNNVDYAMLCHVMLCYAMPWHAMSRNAMLCYAMLCYAMPCHDMSCHEKK